jgi:hypothetical protein
MGIDGGELERHPAVRSLRGYVPKRVVRLDLPVGASVGHTRKVTDLARPSSPAHLRAQLARVEADLAKAQQRKERLEQELERAPYSAGCRQASALKVKLADVHATIAELEARRQDLVSAPESAPEAAPPRAGAHGCPNPSAAPLIPPVPVRGSRA